MIERFVRAVSPAEVNQGPKLVGELASLPMIGTEKLNIVGVLACFVGGQGLENPLVVDNLAVDLLLELQGRYGPTGIHQGLPARRVSGPIHEGFADAVIVGIGVQLMALAEHSEQGDVGSVQDVLFVAEDPGVALSDGQVEVAGELGIGGEGDIVEDKAKHKGHHRQEDQGAEPS